MNSSTIIWNIFTSCLDILAVSLIIYLLIKVLSKSKKNIMILLVLFGYGIVYIIAHLLNLQTLSFILGQVYTWGIIILVILFQNEIRSSLEKVGSLSSLFSQSKKQDESYLQAFEDGVVDLAQHKIGALIAFEKTVSLSQYYKGAVSIDAEFSKYLLKSIFVKESPLHDGAMIINDGKIVCASSYFPIAIDLDLDKQFGTRHRAGVTISRETDAIIVIVSEETGHIAIAYQGNLYDNVDSEYLINFIATKLEE